MREGDSVMYTIIVLTDDSTTADSNVAVSALLGLISAVQ